MEKKRDLDYFNYLSSRSLLGFVYRRFFLYRKLCKNLQGRTLDIGCGLGDMLAFRKNTIGIDINLFNVKFCQKKNLNAFPMSLNVIPFPENTFDSVLLDNVLEHIQNPKLLIKDIRRVLKPNGICLVGVPGIKGFQSDNDHKIFYDELKLKSLFVEFNFEIKTFIYAPFIKSNFLSKYLKQYCIYVKLKKIKSN